MEIGTLETDVTLVRAASVLRAMAQVERRKRGEALRRHRDWAAMGHADRAAALEEGAAAIMLLAPPKAAGRLAENVAAVVACVLLATQDKRDGRHAAAASG
jgi:hypothetical protein